MVPVDFEVALLVVGGVAVGIWYVAGYLRGRDERAQRGDRRGGDDG